MLVGKNLLIKQPHTSKICIMYYLQHKRLQHTCNASSFRGTTTQKKNVVATHCTNNTLFHSTIYNPKNFLYHALSFLGQLPKNNCIRVLPFSGKMGTQNFFRGDARTLHVRWRLKCTTLNDQLPHVFTSSLVIETSRDNHRSLS